jgi:O-antigen/teichoic acid export membrane protein
MPAIANLFGCGRLDTARVVLTRLISILIWMTMLVVAGFLGLNRSFVGLWVGAQFFSGHEVNVGIVLGIALGVTASTFANLCYALGNIKGNSLANGLQSILTILLVALGADAFGLVGVAFAPAVGVAFVGMIYFPRRFASLVNLQRAEVRVLVREFALATAAAVPAVTLALIWSPCTWGSFAASGVTLAAIYTVLVAIMSSRFRYEAKAWMAGPLRAASQSTSA